MTESNRGAGQGERDGPAGETPPVAATREWLFCLDVDNTLVDNDRAKADQAVELTRLLGEAPAVRFWEHYEAVRAQTGVVDYPATLASFRAAFPAEPGYPAAADYLLGFPYRGYVYDRVPAVVHHLNRLGSAMILSDGDAVFQPAKIGRAGLAALVGGRVMVQPHKQAVLDRLVARWPARRLVFVDDKPDLLAAAKRHFGDRAVTVLVEQGKYARRPLAPGDPPPDRRYAAIGELGGLSPGDL